MFQSDTQNDTPRSTYKIAYKACSSPFISLPRMFGSSSARCRSCTFSPAHKQPNRTQRERTWGKRTGLSSLAPIPTSHTDSLLQSTCPNVPRICSQIQWRREYKDKTNSSSLPPNEIIFKKGPQWSIAFIQPRRCRCC